MLPDAIGQDHARRFSCSAKPRDANHIFGARAAAHLLPAALDQCAARYPVPARHNNAPTPLGPPSLCGREISAIGPTPRQRKATAIYQISLGHIAHGQQVRQGLHDTRFRNWPVARPVGSLSRFRNCASPIASVWPGPKGRSASLDRSKCHSASCSMPEPTDRALGASAAPRPRSQPEVNTTSCGIGTQMRWPPARGHSTNRLGRAPFGMHRGRVAAQHPSPQSSRARASGCRSRCCRVMIQINPRQKWRPSTSFLRRQFA